MDDVDRRRTTNNWCLRTDLKFKRWYTLQLIQYALLQLPSTQWTTDDWHCIEWFSVHSCSRRTPFPRGGGVDTIFISIHSNNFKLSVLVSISWFKDFFQSRNLWKYCTSSNRAVTDTNIASTLDPHTCYISQAKRWVLHAYNFLSICTIFRIFIICHF